MKAVIYVENNTNAIYLGQIMANHSMTVYDALDLIGFDESRFIAKMHWDGFDVDAVRIVDAEDIPDIEQGDEVPMTRIILKTAEGPEYIEVPDIGQDVWGLISLYDDINGTNLYDLVNEKSVLAVGSECESYTASPLDMDDLSEIRSERVHAMDQVTATVRVSSAGNSLALNVTPQLRMLGVERGDYVKVTIERADRKP